MSSVPGIPAGDLAGNPVRGVLDGNPVGVRLPRDDGALTADRFGLAAWRHFQSADLWLDKAGREQGGGVTLPATAGYCWPLFLPPQREQGLPGKLPCWIQKFGSY